MKAAIYALILPALISTSHGGEIPFDVQSVIQDRDQAIKKIDASYLDSLTRLRVKYLRNKDQAAVESIDSLIKTASLEKLVATTTVNQGLFGDWVFNYKNMDRKFQFTQDHIFHGQYSISGRDFAGIWRAEGKDIILVVNGADFGTVTLSPSGSTADFQSGAYHMTGRKSAH